MARKLSKNWIMSYAEGYAPFTEAPTQFMIWSGISAIGAVLKNRVYFKHGTFTIYPNQYVILTSDPGIGKGSSMWPVWNMVQNLGLCNEIPDRTTAAKICERLANGFTGPIAPINGQIAFKKDSTATIVVSELSNLLSASDWMLGLLCDLWDRGRFNYDTKNSGTANIIGGMCVSLLGACVPDYLRHINKDTTAKLNGGFTARALFIFADEVSQRIALPQDIESTQHGKSLIEKLKNDIVEISSLSGQYKFDLEAEHLYIKNYNSIRIKDDDSDVVRHFKRRMHVHIIKLAMVFSASQRGPDKNGELTINKIDLYNAIACINDVMANLDKAFRGIGDSDLAEATARVQDFIDKKGSVTYREILSHLHRHVNQENLTRIMDVMYTIGYCEERSVGNQKLICRTKPKSNYTVKTTINSLKV